jgi:hypothetical protein
LPIGLDHVGVGRLGAVLVVAVVALTVVVARPVVAPRRAGDAALPSWRRSLLAARPSSRAFVDFCGGDALSRAACRRRGVPSAMRRRWIERRAYAGADGASAPPVLFRGSLLWSLPVLASPAVCCCSSTPYVWAPPPRRISSGGRVSSSC